MKPPHNVSYLEKALRALAGTDELLVHLRRVLANVIPHTKMTINATRQEQNFIIPQQMTPLGAP